METVTDGVHRLGTRWVNFYLIEEGDALTLVDTGFPGYVPLVRDALERLGRNASDVKAIVLTHTHSDHIGGAKVLAEETRAPVFVHSAEADIANGKAKPKGPKGLVANLWRPPLMRFLGHAIANKGASHVTVPHVIPFEDGEVLDVPGKPRVVFSPGHSSAHSALVIESRGLLFSGDAMATLAVNTGATGLMLHPFNEDRRQAVESLSVLEKLGTNILLPGHGEPWRGPIAEAAAAARPGA